jgi:DNA-binding CsgD family transcriptional regulator
MPSNRLGRTLSLAVCAVALFNTIASLSLPVAARRPSTQVALLWLALLLLQAAFYWFGDTLRRRLSLVGYLSAQAATIFVISVTGALLPVGLALFVALTAEAVVLGEDRWGSVRITLAAILAFGATAIASSNMYQGARSGLILAITGLVAHAATAAIRARRAENSEASAPVETAPASTSLDLSIEGALTPREREVLDGAVAGLKSADIASRLGITERTVKAHLASIYRKLGVDSRAGAISAALRAANQPRDPRA